MNYMQLKTGPGAVSGEEREGFCLKAYRKSELAGLYFPQAGKKVPCRGWGDGSSSVRNWKGSSSGRATRKTASFS